MTQNANWGQELIDLYDKNQDQIGVMEYRGEIPYTLLPLYHSTLEAQITVTIYQDGTFLRAEVVDPGDKMTVIPVTEKSGSRTSGSAVRSGAVSGRGLWAVFQRRSGML